MYPSKKDPTYGVFVKNFKEQMEKEQFDISRTAVIRGRGKNTFEKILKYIKFFRDTIVLIKQNDYDLIYVHYIGHSLLPLLFVQNAIKKPLILNAHGSDVFTANRIKKYIQKLVTPIIKNANLIVVPSGYFEDVLHHKFQIEKNKIFVSPSGGIDTSWFKPLYNTHKNNDEFVIGYVSRIDEGKGWDILLEATKSLLDRGIANFKVLMIGGGAQEEELLHMTEALGLSDHIDFIGKIPHKELVYYYNKMNVFTFTTTLNESLGLVGLEAMACGVPVIVSDIGGMKEYVESGVNGELFQTGNIHALSKEMEKFILMDKALLHRYSRYSIDTVQKYDCKLVSQNMRDKLENMIPKR